MNNMLPRSNAKIIYCATAHYCFGQRIGYRADSDLYYRCRFGFEYRVNADILFWCDCNILHFRYIWIRLWYR